MRGNMEHPADAQEVGSIATVLSDERVAGLPPRRPPARIRGVVVRHHLPLVLLATLSNARHLPTKHQHSQRLFEAVGHALSTQVPRGEDRALASVAEGFVEAVSGRCGEAGRLYRLLSHDDTPEVALGHFVSKKSLYIYKYVS